MINETVSHVERTWKHVLNGNSTTAEKVEFGAEALGLASLVVLSKAGITRYLPTAAKSVETSLPKLELSNSKNIVGSDSLKIVSAAQNELMPVSMNPKAFKVLRGDSALFDDQAKYPLPTLGKDGQWVPGQWVEPRHSKNIDGIQSWIHGNSRQKTGLFISDKPQMWKAGNPNHTTYEIEIGDAASKADWASNTLRTDFVAQRIRLLRPVTPDEIKALPPPNLSDMFAPLFKTPEDVYKFMKIATEPRARIRPLTAGPRLGDSPADYAVDPNMSHIERLIHLRNLGQ
ncbi:hypothetical protein KA344_07780 [bacterium]|jgi:hypothetical protein|nr:hypothetical protein [bacterium]